MLIRFYKKFFLKRKIDDRSYVLVVLLLGAFLLSLSSIVIEAFNWLFYDASYMPFLLSLLIGAICLLCLKYAILQHKIVSIVFILLFIIPTTFFVYGQGMHLSYMFSIYSLAIVLTGILLGSTAAIFLCLCVVGYSIYFFFQKSFAIDISLSMLWSDNYSIVNMLFGVQIILLMTLVTTLYNYRINKTLAELRKSQELLKKEKSLLHFKVKQKTEELQLASLEKIYQLEKINMFGKLASGIFHEIASPLTAISLNLSMLAKSKHLASEDREYVNNSHESILVLEKYLQAAGTHLKNKNIITIFSPKKEIEKIVKLYSYKLKLSKIELIFKYNFTPRLKGDAIKFNQAISSLVSNAIDSFDGLVDKDNKLKISMVKINNNLHISIKDNGCGISPQDLNKIFEPFYSSKQLKNGTGLGLPFAKKIIEEDFGGKINISSTINAGSEFIIILPVK
jgi:signal transduction histidine kinase